MAIAQTLTLGITLPLTRTLSLKPCFPCTVNVLPNQITQVLRQPRLLVRLLQQLRPVVPLTAVTQHLHH